MNLAFIILSLLGVASCGRLDNLYLPVSPSKLNDQNLDPKSNYQNHQNSGSSALNNIQDVPSKYSAPSGFSAGNTAQASIQDSQVASFSNSRPSINNQYGSPSFGQNQQHSSNQFSSNNKPSGEFGAPFSSANQNVGQATSPSLGQNQNKPSTQYGSPSSTSNEIFGQSTSQNFGQSPSFNQNQQGPSTQYGSSSNADQKFQSAPQNFGQSPSFNQNQQGPSTQYGSPSNADQKFESALQNFGQSPAATTYGSPSFSQNQKGPSTQYGSPSNFNQKFGESTPQNFEQSPAATTYGSPSFGQNQKGLSTQYGSPSNKFKPSTSQNFGQSPSGSPSFSQNQRETSTQYGSSFSSSSNKFGPTQKFGQNQPGTGFPNAQESFNLQNQFGASVQKSNLKQVPILRLENNNFGDGTYQYAYETADGISAEEQGDARGNGTKAQGQFSYTSPEGQQLGVTYIADENGFQPQGAHLPTSPPVPEAILRSLEINRASEGQNQGYDSERGPYNSESRKKEEYQTKNGFAKQNGNGFQSQQTAGNGYRYEAPQKSNLVNYGAANQYQPAGLLSGNQNEAGQKRINSFIEVQDQNGQQPPLGHKNDGQSDQFKAQFSGLIQNTAPRQPLAENGGYQY